jgi:hypothetical protein
MGQHEHRRVIALRARDEPFIRSHGLFACFDDAFSAASAASA